QSCKAVFGSAAEHNSAAATKTTTKKESSVCMRDETRCTRLRRGVSGLDGGVPVQSTRPAMVCEKEESQDHGHGQREPTPEDLPTRAAGGRAGVEPEARPQITQQAADATAHQGHQRLRPRTPGWMNPLLQRDL